MHSSTYRIHGHPQHRRYSLLLHDILTPTLPTAARPAQPRKSQHPHRSPFESQPALPQCPNRYRHPLPPPEDHHLPKLRPQSPLRRPLHRRPQRLFRRSRRSPRTAPATPLRHRTARPLVTASPRFATYSARNGGDWREYTCGSTPAEDSH